MSPKLYVQSYMQNQTWQWQHRALVCFFSKKSESTYKYLEVGWTRNLVKTCKRLKTRVGK